MYNLELTEEELKIHVTGLDSSVKLACQQIAQNQSSGFMLKQLLPTLISLDQQFDKLSEVLTKQEKKNNLIAQFNEPKEPHTDSPPA